MKILWIKTDFLHPTTRGGQIRTLEMLRRLHERHEIHYVAFEDPAEPEGLARSGEYCSRAYPVRHNVPSKRSPAFAAQLASGLFSALPVAVDRYRSAEMERAVTELRRTHNFDSVICDFLAPAPNIADFRGCILFQHNVETTIWDRHVQHAADPIRRAYLRAQARKMRAYEGEVCRAVSGIVAVSETDADLMRSMFSVSDVTAVPTGVDLEYFTPAEPSGQTADLVFVGSMDWLPNVDGMKWFVRDILPLIRKRRPDCSVAIVGRRPGPEIEAMAAADPLIRVTGTVPDIRPFVWGSAVSIVPLRIGGGTRLKIFESMAAQTPVVSTRVGAEGLDVRSPEHILLADEAGDFAASCLRLLDDPGERRRMAASARELVRSRFSWNAVAQMFEQAIGVAAAHR